MSIYQELLDSMVPGLFADEVTIGPFLTAVRAGDRCGLATTLRPPGHDHRPALKSPGGLSGQPLAELARLVHSSLPLEAGLGMAAINTGLDWTGLRLLERNGADYIRELAEDRNLVAVGHFSFIHELAPLTLSTVILELDPRSGDLPSTAAARVIPEADVVAITGSAFSNHTIENLLELARGKIIMVLGPTSPLSPLLFNRGVQVIAGSKVADVGLTIRQVREGAVFKQLDGVSRVLMTRPSP